MEIALGIVTLLLIAQSVRAWWYRKAFNVTCQVAQDWDRIYTEASRQRDELLNHNAVLLKRLQPKDAEWPDEIV